MKKVLNYLKNKSKLFNFKSYYRNNFLKNTLILSSGSVIAQTFPIIFYPILARIYTPDDFGVLATLTSISAILVVLSSLKYESSILIAKNKLNAVNIIGLIIALALVVLTISTIILFLFFDQISFLMNVPNLLKYLYLPPLSAFAIVIYKCYNEWCVRNKYFVPLSVNKIINTSSNTLGKYLLGFLQFSTNGLIFGDLIGRFIAAFASIYYSIKKDKNIFFQISYSNMISMAKKHIDFPKFLFPGQLIDTLNTQLPVFVIASFFFSKEVGYYSMAMVLLSLPASLISSSIMDVFRQRAQDEWTNNGNCHFIYKKVIKTVFVFLVPVFVSLSLSLPFLFQLFLGEKWVISGNYAQILLPNVCVLFLFQIVSGVFIIANKLKVLFIWQIFSLTITSFSLIIGCYYFKDIKLTLICFVIARVIANLIRLFLTYKYSKGKK